MLITVTIGTVLLTIGVARLLEYAICDYKKKDTENTWKQDDNIPVVAIEEV